jgi:hypothetical protein
MDAVDDYRQARLKLHHSTIAQLMAWQLQAVGARASKPTYSELVDAAVSLCSATEVTRLLGVQLGRVG